MRTAVVLTLALSVPFLAACGSEDDDRKATFCEDVPALLQDISADLDTVGSDPEAAVEALNDAVSKIEDVEPPEDVADEWNRLETAWSDMRDLLERADLDDPAANADLAPEFERLQPELIDSGTAVDEWGQDNC